MFIAERQGFEPRVPRGTTVFKTAAIDHSATSPKLLYKSTSFRKRCKGTHYFQTCKLFAPFLIIFSYYRNFVP